MRPRTQKEFKGSTVVLVIALLFGIVPGILYYLIKRGQVRYCGKCGEEMVEGSSKCQSCGAEVN